MYNIYIYIVIHTHIYIYICLYVYICLYPLLGQDAKHIRSIFALFDTLLDRKGTTTPNNTACIGVNTWETVIVGQDNSFAVPLGEEKEVCRRYACAPQRFEANGTTKDLALEIGADHDRSLGSNTCLDTAELWRSLQT